MLFKGNCLEVMKDMKDSSVDAIITDVPYDFKSEQKIIFHKEFLRLSKSGLVIVFSPPENQWILPADQILFWIKPISTKNTSRRYARFVEMIFVYGEHIWNHDNHWSQYNNVFTDLVDGKKHPYQKPLSLMTRLILNHTKEGDIILDPFAGSGSTGLSCLQNRRNFIGIEKDNETFKILKDRLS